MLSMILELLSIYRIINFVFVGEADQSPLPFFEIDLGQYLVSISTILV